MTHEGGGGRPHSSVGSGWRSFRAGRRVLLVVVALVAAPVVVDAVPAGLVAAGVRSGPGPLDPRQPSSPGAGVLAGRVVEMPPPGSPQADVVLRFVGDEGRWDVSTRSGGAFSIELPAGSYTVAAASGQGVCPSRVEVPADGWQRADVLWPCRRGGDVAVPPPAPPGLVPPAPAGDAPTGGQPPAAPPPPRHRVRQVTEARGPLSGVDGVRARDKPRAAALGGAGPTSTPP